MLTSGVGGSPCVEVLAVVGMFYPRQKSPVQFETLRGQLSSGMTRVIHLPRSGKGFGTVGTNPAAKHTAQDAIASLAMPVMSHERRPMADVGSAVQGFGLAKRAGGHHSCCQGGCQGGEYGGGSMAAVHTFGC